MKNKIKWTIFILLFLLLIYITPKIFLGFLNKESPKTIIYIPNSNDTTDVFWRSIHKGAKLASIEFETELLTMTPESENYIEQNKIILEAIEKKPDAIILAAASQIDTLEVAKQIVENNILLILVDSIVDESIADAVVVTDNYQAGVRLGAAMKPYLHDGDQVGILNHNTNSSTAIERENGIRVGLGNDSERIVKTYYYGTDIEMAEKLTIDMLETYPNISAIVALNQNASIGAGRAIKLKGLEGQVSVFGFDNEKEEIKYLEEGVFEALIIQKPFNMGYLAVETAMKLTGDEKTETHINTGYSLITRENMYTRLNQKLLFPFMEE